MKNSYYEEVHEYRNKILYEWNVDPVKWKEAMKPIEEAYNKVLKQNIFLLFLIPFSLVVFSLLYSFVERSSFYELIISISIALMISLPICVIMLTVAYLGKKRPTQ